MKKYGIYNIIITHYEDHNKNYYIIIKLDNIIMYSYIGNMHKLLTKNKIMEILKSNPEKFRKKLRRFFYDPKIFKGNKILSTYSYKVTLNNEYIMEYLSQNLSNWAIEKLKRKVGNLYIYDKKL